MTVHEAVLQAGDSILKNFLMLNDTYVGEVVHSHKGGKEYFILIQVWILLLNLMNSIIVMQGSSILDSLPN